MTDDRGRRRALPRETLGHDVVAGAVLGVHSVPDGLAAGVLAGVNPLAGLYAYLFGLLGGALLTGTPLLAVQATSAMSLVVADTDVAARPDPAASLAMLGLLTGGFLLLAAALRVGRLVRFAPTAVMAGFLAGVGVKIVLGQVGHLTGYASPAADRLTRFADTLAHVAAWRPASLAVAGVTIALIVVTLRTRAAGVGLVLAVSAGSAVAVALNAWAGASVPLMRDLVALPRGLPLPVLPAWADAPDLVVPALSLALVCVMQGAGVAAGLPPPEGRRASPTRDIVGQGVGNLLSAVFGGLPAGGSLTASSLLLQAGARTRLAQFVAAATMALTIALGSGIVGFAALPALGGLLAVVGVRAVIRARPDAVARAGPYQAVVLTATFALMLLVPLQFAVLAGIGLGLILYVAEHSTRVTLRALHLDAERGLREDDPPAVVPPRSVVALQPHGSLFFASAPRFESLLPRIEPGSVGSVVILRLRGTTHVDLAAADVLRRYAERLAAHGSTLKLAAVDPDVLAGLRAAGLVDAVGEANVYPGGAWVGEAFRRAHADASAQVAAGGAAPEGRPATSL
ncbi:SulP family inorganic anion transporter [Propioniciclava coleopterorum]|uniref:SulP family inorganic anion transporter n=1 Tax=Propioniciclava coleopterorum TaxID=2714937 RepID=A0A6G7YAV5_9ACTN|nr:SulP family inorganic anion transporter [Propioniciclava coleopterorum]